MTIAFKMEPFDRIIFWSTQDRIGPDMPLTHWMLYFKSLMRKLCKKKFGFFHDTAEFRPGAYAVCCSNIHVGKNVVIRPCSMLFADPTAMIILEDDVMLGAGVHVYVNDHNHDDPTRPIIEQGHYPSENVIIKTGCWVGANAIILSGVTIGENTVIGAGSVVTKSVPPRVVAVGNPAKVIKEIGK